MPPTGQHPTGPHPPMPHTGPPPMQPGVPPPLNRKESQEEDTMKNLRKTFAGIFGDM